MELGTPPKKNYIFIKICCLRYAGFLFFSGREKDCKVVDYMQRFFVFFKHGMSCGYNRIICANLSLSPQKRHRKGRVAPAYNPYL